MFLYHRKARGFRRERIRSDYSVTRPLVGRSRKADGEDELREAAP